jgi:hypothetical protein
MPSETAIKATTESAGGSVNFHDELKTLKGSVAEYIKEKEDDQRTEASQHSRLVSQQFVTVTNKQFVDEIRREDIARFHAALRKRGCLDRSGLTGSATVSRLRSETMRPPSAEMS